MTLQTLLEGIAPTDENAKRESQHRWGQIAKPLGSLGLLEEEIIRMAGIFGTAEIAPLKPAVIVMCADNGVVAEGVTQTGQEVTAIVAENMSSGHTSVCRMAARAGAEVIPVDIGVVTPLTGEKILQKNIRRGTGNIACEPAMTRDEAERAILVGANLVGELKSQGYNIIATGEMGIGNTTTSSAIAAVLLGIAPEVVTGRGAGLSDAGLQRKITAIKSAIAVNQPNPNDPIDVLSKVGGLDLAGLAGVFLGGAYHKIPVLVDGVISMAAALIAVRICPAVKDYIIGSHATAEPAGELFLSELGLRPFLFAGMRLGEGTGAVAVLPILDMALAVYSQMSTFEQISIEPYQEKPI